VDPRGGLRRNIALSVSVYYLAQGALFGIPAIFLELSGSVVPLFFVVSFLYHVGILCFLLLRIGDLRLIGDGTMLSAINGACHLTLVRLSAMPTVVFLVAASDRPIMAAVIVPLAALVFATDFADGRVARSRGQLTVMGQYLDSSTDYVVLLGSCIASAILGIIPLWYTAVLFGRLVLFAVAMGLLSLARGKVEPETTFLGKAAVFAAMATYGFQLSRWYGIPIIGDRTVVRIVEIATAAILVVSMGDKILYVARKLRRSRER